MKRTTPDGSTMDYYQTASGRESFTMDNVSLGFEIDSMSNLGASFGVTRYGLRHNGYPTKKYVGGIHCAGFQYSNFTSSLKKPGVLRSSNFPNRNSQERHALVIFVYGRSGLILSIFASLFIINTCSVKLRCSMFWRCPL